MAPKIKTARTSVDEPTSLLEGELVYHKPSQTLMIGELHSDGTVHPKKIQKEITISDRAPTPDEGIEGDIWLQYLQD